VATDIGAALTPSTIGGSYAKLGILTTYGFSPGEATLVTLLGTIEDAGFFAIALPLSLVITGAWDDPGVKQLLRNFGSYWPWFLAIGAVVILAYALLVSWRRNKSTAVLAAPENASRSIFSRLRAKWREYKGQFASASKFVREKHRRTFLACILFSGIGWTCRYSVITLLVLGLGYPADLVLFFFLQWVVFTLMGLFPTPGAVGGAEISFALIFRGFVPSGAIPIITGAWRFLTFYLIMIVGALIVVFFGAGNFDRKLKRLPQDAAAEINVK
jgi:uncharacterized protein (TIRG00374 family)